MPEEKQPDQPPQKQQKQSEPNYRLRAGTVVGSVHIDPDSLRYLDTQAIGHLGSRNYEYLVGSSQGTIFHSSHTDAEVDSLKKDLATTTNQITAMQKQVAGLQAQLTKNTQTEQNQAIQAEVAAIAQTVDQVQTQLAQAQRQTEGLTAPVIMPTPEDMQIRLVPTHWLHRLEEYRADEGITLASACLFVGAILGILVNWATNEQLVITRFSMVLMGLFAVLAVSLVLWVVRTHRRATIIRDQMLRFTNVQQVTAPRTDQNRASPPTP